MKNYYDLLEVTPKASKEIIEKAYRVLIKKYHPDLYHGEERIYAENKSRELNEAYRVLSSDFLREQYDLELEKERKFNNENAINNNYSKKNNKFDNQKEQSKAPNKKQEKEEKTHKVGTIMSMVDLLKEIFKKRNRSEGPRKLQKEDKIAAVLTLIIVIVIGVALWFIPFTHSFIRDLIPF